MLLREENKMQLEQKNNRYVCFDILKCLCSFMIVCIHKGFAKGAGPIRMVSRMAVPVFFMISGFFYCRNKLNKKTINKGKLLKFYLFWCLIYAIYSIIHNLLKGISISDYLNNMFSLQSIFEFIFLNYHPLIGVIWYLGAYLYSLIVIDYLYDKGYKKILYKLSPILLIIGIFLGTFSRYMFGTTFSVAYSRNFIFIGIPFIVFGMQIYENKEKILAKKKTINIVLEPIFIVLAFFEYFYLKNNYDLIRGDVFISSVCLSINTFILFLKYYNNKEPNKVESILAKIGMEYSAGVYYIHIIVKNILDILTSNNMLNKVYTMFAPLLIYLACTAVIFIYKKTIYKRLTFMF